MPEEPQAPRHRGDRHGRIAVEAGVEHLADAADSLRHAAEMPVCLAAVEAGGAAEEFELVVEVVEHQQALPHE